MKVLFIGGSGNISSACTEEVLRLGYEVIHFNRGISAQYKFGNKVISVQGDINIPTDRDKLIRYAPYDVVVDFICFTPEQMQADIDFFRGKIAQFIFISSATVYKKPSDHYIITEECPLSNPHWEYAQDKIKCEHMLTGQNVVNYTIVRPSYTYGRTWLPVAFTAREYNPVYRIREGLPLISHGDGESLWVMTHHTDFARAFTGLFGNPKAMNNHFHITSDEVHTWDQIYRIIGCTVGIEPKLIHIPSDFINSYVPEWGASLLGDKARSVVFNNEKIKSIVPGWHAEKSFADGIRESITWFEEKPERMQVNTDVEIKTDLLIKKFSTK
jgi:nucleoside-diphosphate-sugar epimerase